jgi:hypothetical protein
MGQDIRTERLADAQHETQEDPGEQEGPGKDLALKALRNQYHGLREGPLIDEIWLDSKYRDQGREHN